MGSYDEAVGGETTIAKLRSGDYTCIYFFLKNTNSLFSKIPSFEIGSPSFGTFRRFMIQFK